MLIKEVSESKKQHDTEKSEPRGQSAAYAVVTSISNTCVKFKIGGHWLRLGAPGLLREHGF